MTTSISVSGARQQQAKLKVYCMFSSVFHVNDIKWE